MLSPPSAKNSSTWPLMRQLRVAASTCFRVSSRASSGGGQAMSVEAPARKFSRSPSTLQVPISWLQPTVAE